MFENPFSYYNKPFKLKVAKAFVNYLAKDGNDPLDVELMYQTLMSVNPLTKLGDGFNLTPELHLRILEQYEKQFLATIELIEAQKRLYSIVTFYDKKINETRKGQIMKIERKRCGSYNYIKFLIYVCDSNDYFVLTGEVLLKSKDQLTFIQTKDEFDKAYYKYIKKSKQN